MVLRDNDGGRYMNIKATDKASLYAKNLIQSIENEHLKRKCLPNHGDVYSGPREELSLFQYKRYIGSLRCMIDMKTMREFDRYGY